MILKKPPSSKKKINLAKPSEINKTIKGQFGQPWKIEQALKEHKLWWKKKQGFFVEAGVSNGEHLSNTLYFELKYNWTGLLIEPNPNFLKVLKTKNRKSWILPHCLSTNPRVEVVDIDSSYNGSLIKQGKSLQLDVKRPENCKRSYKEFPKTTIKVSFGLH